MKTYWNERLSTVSFTGKDMRISIFNRCFKISSAVVNCRTGSSDPYCIVRIDNEAIIRYSMTHFLFSPRLMFGPFLISSWMISVDVKGSFAPNHIFIPVFVTDYYLHRTNCWEQRWGKQQMRWLVVPRAVMKYRFIYQWRLNPQARPLGATSANQNESCWKVH